MRGEHFLAATSRLLFVAALAVAGPALALDALDGSAHPSVGHIFAQQSDPSTCSAEVVASCSATLISSTVAVTSGACAEVLVNASEYGYNLTAIWISFNGSDPFDCATASRVSSVQFHPSFDENQPGNPVDIGVAVLASPAAVTPATLPAAGSLDGLVHGDPFDSVGWDYDLNGNVNTARRRIGPVIYRSGNPDFVTMRLTQSGGTCATGFDGGGAFYAGTQDLAGLDNGAGGQRVQERGVPAPRHRDQPGLPRRLRDAALARAGIALPVTPRPLARRGERPPTRRVIPSGFIMIDDRIVQAEQVATLLRGYLEGSLDGSRAAYEAMRLASSTDRILAGHQTRAVVEAYWALRRLAESGPMRPDRDRIEFLLACVEGRRRFPTAE